MIRKVPIHKGCPECGGEGRGGQQLVTTPFFKSILQTFSSGCPAPIANTNRVMGIELQSTVAAPIIMIADCDDDDRSLLRALLEFKGFSVVEAANGKQAIDVVMETRPALILIELKLPIMNGFTVIRNIRRHSRFTGIPIVAVSDDRHTSHRRLALAAGCAAHIKKPLELHALDSVLDQFLPGQRWQFVSVMIH